MSRLEGDDLQWALQRRIEDVFAKLGEKFGDLTGRVETEIKPSVSFDDVGGLRSAKALLRGFTLALTSPERYERWGIPPGDSPFCSCPDSVLASRGQRFRRPRR